MQRECTSVVADVIQEKCRDWDLDCCAVELLELVKGEARGCRDVPSLTWAATSLCHLAGAPAPACFGALHALLTLLVNRYPKVGPAS